MCKDGSRKLFWKKIVLFSSMFIEWKIVIGRYFIRLLERIIIVV